MDPFPPLLPPTSDNPQKIKKKKQMEMKEKVYGSFSYEMYTIWSLIGKICFVDTPCYSLCAAMDP